MNLAFATDTYYLIALHIVSIFFLVAVNFAIWLRAKKIPLLYTYMSVQLILLLWMSAKILKTVSPNAQIKFLFVVIQYIGVGFVGVLFFRFACLYAMGRLPGNRTVGLLCIVPSFSLLALITNPYHLLFYSRFEFWGDSFGPVFYVHQAYNYALLCAGIALCSRYFFRQFGPKRTQAVLFSAAILVPLAANVIYVFSWTEALFGFSPPCDITPISCNLSLAMFALAVFRYRFFDDVKIARRTALDALPDGILILGRDGRTADYNETFETMYLDGLLDSADGKPFAVSAAAPSPLKRGQAGFILPQEPRDVVYQSACGRYIRLICRTVEGRRLPRGCAFQFSDDTDRQTLLKETVEKNQALITLNGSLQRQAALQSQLTMARTRNYIAREIHDVLGHSVVLVLSLLEASRPSIGKQNSESRGLIARARLTLEECGKKSPLKGPLTVSGGSMLERELEAMIREVRSAALEVELTVTGQLPPLPQAGAEAAFKLCREGVTNAIRHGGAKRIDIILRGRPGLLEVYLIDNGRGCGQVQKGMGLTGMEERLRAVGGEFDFGPMEGAVFGSTPESLSDKLVFQREHGQLGPVLLARHAENT
jgi:signal transduction histidine kinase